jgi:hypothetical protein
MNRFVRLGIGLAVVALGGFLLWIAVLKPNFGEPRLIEPLTLADDAPVDYNFHVKPILSNNCFACHGFDANTREMGLRLDTREGATENYAPEGEAPKVAIVPGSPEESEIWKRINHHNEDLRMPPVESNKEALTDEEKSIIKRWIAQGAEYKTHWSFIPPVKSELPKVKKRSWPRSKLDYHILAKLEALGTRPSPEADKETLIRRVTLDLTGLPPTPEEVDAFLKDRSDDAYEKVVDRLLASPHYGERMALEWLDVSRYGDTNAHHVDLIRTSWPWRDWVIRAFNENKPYDEFIIEQMAGDLLENPTQNQILATSFHRNHPITNEGGAIDQEYLVEYAADRVHTVSTAFMGMTMACARCHDHKYDPFSIDEYYSMMSFFNSIHEVGLERQDSKEAEGYKPYIYIAANVEDQKAIDEAKAVIDRVMPSMTTDEINSKLKETAEVDPLTWKRLKPALAHALWNGKEFKNPRPQGLGLNLSVDQQKKIYDEAGTLSFDVSLDEMPDGSNMLALQIFSLKFNEVGDSRNLTTLEGGSKISDIRLRMVSGGHQDVKIEATLPVREFWSNDSLFANEQGVDLAFDGDDATHWKLEPSNRPMMLLVRLEEPLSKGTEDQRLRLEFDIAENSFPPILKNGAHLFAAQSPVAFQAHRERVSPFSLVTVAPKSIYNTYRNQLKVEWAISEGALEPGALAEWAQASDRIYSLMENSVRVAIMEEKDEPTPTFVLDRGAYDAPLKDRPVGREIPAIFGEMDPDYPRDRLGFAYWLVDEDNPLTARVTVNRYWQMIFGTGIVRTSEDFGAQGELPTHPELLDYLAVDFIESGWDTKALIRKMVTSATYRQQSVRRPEFDLADPENRFLAWFPRLRLPAEFIRDNALAASGLLVDKIGGPSVKPYQPDGLWREKTMRPSSNTGQFKRDSGEDLYRRGMYTFWKQVAPPPQMEAFDAPSREVCVIRRNTTNTPMQALVLLNDETYLEISRAMASRLIREVPGIWEETLDDRLILCYRYLTGRTPSDESLDVLRQLTRDSFAAFSSDSEKAKGFLSYGESPQDETADSAELATLAYTASALLNLDKTITRD